VGSDGAASAHVWTCCWSLASLAFQSLHTRQRRVCKHVSINVKDRERGPPSFCAPRSQEKEQKGERNFRIHLLGIPAAGGRQQDTGKDLSSKLWSGEGTRERLLALINAFLNLTFAVSAVLAPPVAIRYRGTILVAQITDLQFTAHEYTSSPLRTDPPYENCRPRSTGRVFRSRRMLPSLTEADCASLVVTHPNLHACSRPTATVSVLVGVSKPRQALTWSPPTRASFCSPHMRRSWNDRTSARRAASALSTFRPSCGEAALTHFPPDLQPYLPPSPPVSSPPSALSAPEYACPPRA